jgi:hypothetical protein
LIIFLRKYDVKCSLICDLDYAKNVTKDSDTLKKDLDDFKNNFYEKFKFIMFGVETENYFQRLFYYLIFTRTFEINEKK